MIKKINEIKNDHVATVERCDFVGRKIGSVKKTDEGYLQGTAPVAKIGIMTYYLQDGTTRRELVTEDTLFNVDSMVTLKMKPITDQHPPETTLDAKTVKRRKVGFTGETIKKDGDFLTSTITVTDIDAVENITENGRKELSPGYRCEVLLTPGIFQRDGHPQNGEKYDAIQLNRKYNHLALCDRARGGRDLMLHIDSIEMDKIDGFEIQTNNKKQAKGAKPMPTINIDGIQYEAAQEVINHLNKIQKKVDETEVKVSEATKKADEVQGKLDAVTSEKEGLAKKLDEAAKIDHTDAINAGIKERLALVEAAKHTLDEEQVEKIDSMVNSEIKKAVIIKKLPSIDLAEKTDGYVNACFDTVVASINFDGDAIGNQRKKASQQSRNDGSPEDRVEKARKDAEDAIINNYKTLGGRIKE